MGKAWLKGLLLVVWAIGAGPALAVTTQEDASGGCDGIKNGAWGFHTASNELDPWWQVDLGKAVPVDRVVIFNRTGRGCAGRTARIEVLTANGPEDAFQTVYRHDGSTFYGVREKKPLVVKLAGQGVIARIVRLRVSGRCSFALDEVEVYAVDDPGKNIALRKPADQKSVGPYSSPGTGEFAERGKRLVQKKASRPGTMETLVKQAEELAARLRPDAGTEAIDPLMARLKEAMTLDEARSLKRRIAFCNPKLRSIDKLLFIKRHDAGGPYHMCDQYYGCNARPGGGLFVLKRPFGARPELVDLLKDSVVEKGRLKGRKLDSGSFLSPEVSFDGKTILFAYSECKATKTYTWGPEISYHIFKVNADGTGLVQLTDGPSDDFDPCFLPNGRIVFISLRRGGYLRCGRHCPVYTLFSMEPDGSDIVCLSFHETHEWHPSVDHNGMIVYTRWDYVDRDTNVAHHPWLCYPDGRDPRSFHGNYPVNRGSRPWMEMSIRAVPDSHKFVATAAAHHGHAFGSLVLLDQSLEDDNAMSQLTRLTPEVPFPEAEGGRNCQQFATPWPLSEDDYLCVYDPAARNHALYWIDRFGNREKIYGDPGIPCLSPIPLGRRPRPPILAEATTQTVRGRKALGGDRPATISVMNVYDSDFEWPEDTKITDLRVIQVLPKSTAPPNRPRIGVANQTNARAVLGTVPVEEDGSAHFEAPVGIPIYFQALDRDGMAVQSMRSATYVHPGERLNCQGCHEPKRRAPIMESTVRLALQRAPSKIRPDLEGANPFNYPRLVQPALDRNCVECHQKEKTLDLTGVVEKNGFTRSYNNLAKKYGFYFHVSNGSIRDKLHGGSRSIAGKFGARAAPLMKYLDKSHYGLDLSKEDLHRITLWLDCNSEFLGAYENAPAQARGEVVHPELR